MFSRKLKISLAAALVVALGLTAAVFFWAGQPSVGPELAPNSQLAVPERAVFNLTIDFGAGADAIQSFELATDGLESLLQIMKTELPARGLEIISASYAGLGELVSQIGGRQSGAGRYWQYWVNGNYAQTGAGIYIIKAGDRVVWKLTD